jgi:hypothetical protein
MATGEKIARQRLVGAWIELYQVELLENWNHAEAGEPLNKVRR